MTQQNNQSNLFESNEFQLAGECVQITYLTGDRDGKPHLTYKDDEYDRSFTGDEIRIQQSEPGTLATVMLHYLPDVGSDTFTLIVPQVRVAELSEPVETLAIKCHHSMTMIPQPGVAQSYQVIPLQGSVQNPFLR
ncbi:MAG: hypothetical protein NVSMB27_09970 [Ktedonobacteraceae bacterium]